MSHFASSQLDGLTFYYCSTYMFNLMKVKGKSVGRTLRQPTPLPPTKVPVEGAGRCPDEGGGKSLRNKRKVTISKRLKEAIPKEGSERAPRNKGKEPAMEAAESPDYPPTMRELCEVDGRVGRIDILWHKFSSYHDSRPRTC
ncbi:hypothetical protein BHE74_00027613 [Ensete ventricosum]|nr:hypothetical protein BHE74_00027613 [Ensete ventricosum]